MLCKEMINSNLQLFRAAHNIEKGLDRDVRNSLGNFIDRCVLYQFRDLEFKINKTVE